MKSLILTVLMMFIIGCSVQKELVQTETMTKYDNAYLDVLCGGHQGAVEDALFIVLLCDIHNYIKINYQIHETIKSLAMTGKTEKIRSRALLISYYLDSDDKFLRAKIKSEYYNKEKMFELLANMLETEKSVVTQNQVH